MLKRTKDEIAGDFLRARIRQGPTLEIHKLAPHVKDFLLRNPHFIAAERLKIGEGKNAIVQPGKAAAKQPVDAKAWDFDPDCVIHRSLWPKECRDLAAYFQDSDAGLGDVAARLLHDKGTSVFSALKSLVANFGFTNTLDGIFKHLTGQQCECATKQYKLNRRYPRSEWIKARQKLAIWTYADGNYAFMANGLARSLKQNGCKADFHAYSSLKVPAADYTHLHQINLGGGGNERWLAKFDLLREHVAKLDYDAYLWLDSDNFCVRDPGDLMRLLGDDPCHAFLESDMADPKCSQKEWWGPPIEKTVQMMIESGVRGPKFYGTNAGFFIVRRSAVDRVCDLAKKYWDLVRKEGWRVTEEPPLATVAQSLSADPGCHEHLKWLDVWASDWTGEFTNRLPDGSEWTFTDWFQGDLKYRVNPAIVHAMRSDQQLIENGRR